MNNKHRFSKADLNEFDHFEDEDYQVRETIHHRKRDIEAPKKIKPPHRVDKRLRDNEQDRI